MEQQYVNRKSATRHELNPFLQKTSDQIRMGNRTVGTDSRAKHNISNQESGEEFTTTPTIIYNEKVEKGVVFLKIYAEGIRKLFGLPRTASNALCVLLQEYHSKTEWSTDKIYMNWKTAVKKYGYESKQKTFINGINILIQNEIIALSDNDSWYYIDTELFFKGDRYDITTQYKLEKVESNKSV